MKLTKKQREWVFPEWPEFKRKPGKYLNKKTVLYGKTFDSKKEGDRYLQLRYLEKAGEISDLELQKKYRFLVKDKLICTYIADFVYLDKRQDKIVVEDVKSPVTAKLPVYRMKKKMMKIFYDIDIREV